ncbi:MAG: SRPBCC domain-containing protein [Gordonia sp.]|uniref:SRPBCC domain-containing protein n=1 Tax=Gordonia rubripertincta TaxID=36822 RepID=A0ABT4N220_GORRU|nr:MULTISPECIES: SRPBCC domain-containing protein [Mycobacteriales]MBA4023524.1 SRPBCC domain-containing protein [Gordonia sp. (in: high G+C Gram-positive bacteria)]MCZ4553296.1 SRPBCC domain-containing protein [Gordonia rubripertincta]OZG30872.1 polyketide cyclase [Williamsia sp. 1138]
MTDTATREFTIVREFSARPEVVFDAWVDSDQASQWMGPEGFTMPRDRMYGEARPGGEYGGVMVGPAGEEFASSGVYQEVSRPDRLVFSWGDPTDAESVSVCTVSFVESSPGTTTMTFHLLAPGPLSSDDGAKGGWGSSFDKLRRFVEAAS